MELNVFRVFLTVVEEMNFTRAAEKLYITQQSLSGYIKRMETSYGVTLFQRRPVLRLTPEGEAMVQFSRQMLESQNNLLSRFADISESCTAIVNLGLPRQRSQVFFPGIWSSFHTAHPNISVRLHERITQFLLEELQAGQVDMIIGSNISRTTNFELTPLVEEYNCCVLSENLLQRYFPTDWQNRLQRFEQEGVSLMELRDLPLLMLPEQNSVRRLVDLAFHKARIIPNVVLETNEQSIIFSLACFGDGVGIVTGASLYSYSNMHGSLPQHCHFFRLHDLPRNRLSVAVRSDIELPVYMQDLKAAIVEEFGYYDQLVARQNNEDFLALQRRKTESSLTR